MTDSKTTPTDKAGEPWAYGWYDEGGVKRTMAHMPNCDQVGSGIEVHPLYTHPQPLAVGLDRDAVAREAARRVLSVNFDFLAPDMEPSEQREFEDSITNAILALAAPAEGYVLVPVEPTEAMRYDGDRKLANATVNGGSITDTVLAIYRAMIAACLPAAPTGETL